jgi:DNA-binding transcriptional LysR family regulator
MPRGDASFHPERQPPVRKCIRADDGRAMLQPTSRHLEMFRLLMRTSSLTETARIMGVSQPAISQALRELEGQFGFELFLRGKGRIQPSDEALDLLPEIERLFAQFSALTCRASELRDSRAGKIAIATIPVMATGVIPPAIAAFRRDRPRANILLESLPTNQVVDHVKQETADIGFVVRPIEESAIIAEPLFRTSFCCMLPDGHRLATRKTISAEDLLDEPMIALNAQTPLGLVLREELRKLGAQNSFAIETNSAAAAMALVRAGAGMAIVDPLPLLEAGISRVLVRPFEPAVAVTVMALFSRNRALPRIGNQFMQRIRDSLGKSAAAIRALGVPAEII